MRYVVKFTKEGSIKFISHLDLMRTIQRVIRRAEIPIEYSQGFNPHMNLSIAQPLPVGMYSQGEYMDIVLTKELNGEEIIQKLNDSAPSGIKFKNAINVPSIPNIKKVPQIMALVDAAHYGINIRLENGKQIISDMDKLISENEWSTIKKSKSGEKQVDIKPMVKEIKYHIDGDNMKIEALIACGSRENLSPELLSDFVKEHCSGIKKDSFTDIVREEMYAQKGSDLLPIYKYFE